MKIELKNKNNPTKEELIEYTYDFANDFIDTEEGKTIVWSDNKDAKNNKTLTYSSNVHKLSITITDILFPLCFHHNIFYVDMKRSRNGKLLKKAQKYWHLHAIEFLHICMYEHLEINFLFP